MANPTNVIGDAFEKLKRSISEEDAHDFASTTLKDVWIAVRDIENAQRKRQCAQNLRRIEPLLRGIEQYSKVIEVLCNGTPYMPYVWAPIKLMIQLASSHRDVFEALLDAYADIGTALPRFDRYERAFKENREFQNVLAAVYRSILEFHEQAYKFFRRKDFQSRFATVIESLKKQRDFVDTEAASIHIVEAREARARVQYEIERRQRESIEALERNEKNGMIARFQHSVQWLAADDVAQEAECERMSRRRHDGTCEWINKLSQMRQWLKDDTKDSLLWLSGKPGAGKSVICSHIIGVLQQIPRLNTCYFFCNSQGAGTVCSQILRTVALQLLRRSMELASLIANEYVYRGSNCGMAQLRVLIPQLLELVPYTRVVIDGLDECSIDDQKTVIKEVQSLCLRPTIRCKILFSSRQEVYIREKLSGNPHIPLEKREEVESDIQLFVKYKMTQLRTSDRNLLKKLESLLVEKANGMFLWVRLVVEELRQCYNDTDLEEKAMSLPKGLEQAYGRILDRILDNRNSAYIGSIAIRILEWMSCSYRLLKSYEILDGISLRAAEHSNATYRSGCTILNKKTRFQREVLDLCKPLIEDGPGNTVDFVHFSAKEYILKQEYRNARPFIKTEDAHFKISFSCVSYLNSSLCLLPTHCTDQERAAIILQGFHGLQLYANQFWFKHVLACCGLYAKRNIILPNELVNQLQRLLRFHKQARHNTLSFGDLGTGNKFSDEDDDFLALKQLPRDVRALIREVIGFRKTLSMDDSTQKSPEDIAKALCTSDPTYFSKTRHHYQLTLEALLAGHASRTFLGIDVNQLQIFKETYGPSAFTCRYVHCARATDGFETSKKRDEHESAHQRKYRCAHPSCVSFACGFATKRSLNRHNEKYHPTHAKSISLSEGIVLAIRQAPKRKQPTAQVALFSQRSLPNQFMDGARNELQQSKSTAYMSADQETMLGQYETQTHGQQGSASTIQSGTSPNSQLQPPDEDIDMMCSLTNTSRSEAISRLKGNDNSISRAVNEYYESPGRNPYAWDETHFSSDRDASNNKTGICERRSSQTTFQIQGLDSHGTSGCLDRAPSRPPSRANSRSSLGRDDLSEGIITTPATKHFTQPTQIIDHTAPLSSSSTITSPEVQIPASSPFQPQPAWSTKPASFVSKVGRLASLMAPAGTPFRAPSVSVDPHPTKKLLVIELSDDDGPQYKGGSSDDESLSRAEIKPSNFLPKSNKSSFGGNEANNTRHAAFRWFGGKADPWSDEKARVQPQGKPGHANRTS